jgi:hypothetical protein
MGTAAGVSGALAHIADLIEADLLRLAIAVVVAKHR